MATVDTLRSLHALATTLVVRIEEALGEVDPNADLRRGKTPAAIVALLRRRGPLRALQIAEELRAAGRDVTDDAVHQGCSRLVRAGALRKSGPLYAVTEAGSGS